MIGLADEHVQVSAVEPPASTTVKVAPGYSAHRVSHQVQINTWLGAHLHPLAHGRVLQRKVDRSLQTIPISPSRASSEQKTHLCLPHKVHAVLAASRRTLGNDARERERLPEYLLLALVPPVGSGEHDFARPEALGPSVRTVQLGIGEPLGGEVAEVVDERGVDVSDGNSKRELDWVRGSRRGVVQRGWVEERA